MSGRQFVPTLKNKTLKLTQSQERKNEHLLFHVRNGNVLKVQSLLWRGADPNCVNKAGATPLMDAADLGSPEIARVLLDAGADITAQYTGGALGHGLPWRGWNAFVVACNGGHMETVDLLLERGGLTDGSCGGEALLAAAERGHTHIVRLLIDQGVDINYRARWTQTTPLMKACWGGHLEVVELLVRAGAHVNIVDDYGMTVINHARQYAPDSGIVEYLENQAGMGSLGEENPIRIMGGPAEIGSLGANEPSRVEGSLGGTGPVPVEDEMGESDPSRVATPRTRKGGYYRRKTYKKGY